MAIHTLKGRIGGLKSSVFFHLSRKTNIVMSGFSMNVQPWYKCSCTATKQKKYLLICCIYLALSQSESVGCYLKLRLGFARRAACVSHNHDTHQHAVTRCCFMLKSSDLSSVRLLRQDAAAGQTFSHIDFRSCRTFYWTATTRSDPRAALRIILYSLVLLLWSTFTFYSFGSYESELDV